MTLVEININPVDVVVYQWFQTQQVWQLCATLCCEHLCDRHRNHGQRLRTRIQQFHGNIDACVQAHLAQVDDLVVKARKQRELRRWCQGIDEEEQPACEGRMKHQAQSSSQDGQIKSTTCGGDMDVRHRISNFSFFWRARSRLYQNENLQENMRFGSIFQDLQDVHTFAPFQTQYFSNKSV